MVEEHVVGDAVEEGAELPLRLVAVLGPVEPHEGFLGEVLDLGLGPEQTTQEREQRRLVEKWIKSGYVPPM